MLGGPNSEPIRSLIGLLSTPLSKQKQGQEDNQDKPPAERAETLTTKGQCPPSTLTFGSINVNGLDLAAGYHTISFLVI